MSEITSEVSEKASLPQKIYVRNNERGLREGFVTAENLLTPSKESRNRRKKERMCRAAPPEELDREGNLSA
jgi:hypothetical protein